MQTITIIYRDDTETDVFEGEVAVLSNGAVEITMPATKQSGLIAALDTTKTIGIPLEIIRRYIIE